MTASDWVVLVPQKDLSAAKSRLTLSVTARREIAAAMLADTVETASATPSVRGVVVVAETLADADHLASTSVDVVGHHEPGLNAAIRAGEFHARRRWPNTHVAVLPADLPGADSNELARALATATGHPRMFLVDRRGAGTTLLTARVGVQLNPQYGPGSRRAHRQSGAWANASSDLSSLRHDLDDLRDLDDLIGTSSSLDAGRRLRAVLQALRWETHEEIA